MASLSEQEHPRGFAARIGLVLLSLFAPGLSVIRLGRPVEGAAFLFGWPTIVSIFCGIAFLAPAVPPSGYLMMMIAAGLGCGFVVVTSIVESWRLSKVAGRASFWWQRWYGLLVIFALATIANLTVVAIARTTYRPFYIPSASMEPAFAVGDCLIADMRPRDHKRGDVVIFEMRNVDYIKRIAAIGGDRIKLINGQVVINGTPVEQHIVGSYSSEGRRAVRLSERFPGESVGHDILDFGTSETDDMAEQVVPANHVFLLGDNRDNSADSRMAREIGGIGGSVPDHDVRGRVLFKSFDNQMRWIGQGVR